MADYLLDTNILAFWYDESKAEHAKVVAGVNVAKRPDPTSGYMPRLFVSVVTLGEIEFGARVSHVPDPARQAEYARMDAEKMKFVREQCPVALEINAHVAEHYGELMAWLFNNCGPSVKKSKKRRLDQCVNPMTGKELGVDENDIWIAAQAKTHNLVLVTHDSRGNFPKVLEQFAPSLKVEDWAV